MMIKDNTEDQCLKTVKTIKSWMEDFCCEVDSMKAVMELPSTWANVKRP